MALVDYVVWCVYHFTSAQDVIGWHNRLSCCYLTKKPQNQFSGDVDVPMLIESFLEKYSTVFFLSDLKVHS